MVVDAQFPDDWARLPFERRFTASEYERMALGVPRDMDDKWYIYLEGDTFYFHRSWTGLCIFRMRLQEVGGEFVLSEAAVARYTPSPRLWWKLWSRSRPSPPNTYPALAAETSLFTLLVDVALLGKPDPR